MSRYLWLFLMIFTGCRFSDTGNDNNDYTRIFGNYMQSVFHKELPDTLTNFIVIPKTIGCIGCKTTVLNSLINNTLRPNCVLIANIDSTEIPGFTYQYMRDSLSIIERLNLKTRSATLIRVSDRQVTEIIEITPDKTDSVISLLERVD